MKKVFASMGALLACACMSSGAWGAGADTYPDRPITLVVPSPAAGGSDLIARLYADELGKYFKQSVIVDNKPGANGIIGVDSVARAAPDGYRVLFTYAAAVVVNPSLYKKVPYEPLRDLVPVAQIGNTGTLLVVNNDLPAQSVPEFVAYARAHPDRVSYCSWGAGSGGHLAMESLVHQARIKVVHVPYKGTAPCLQALMSGEVQAAFSDVSSTLELVKAGRMRPIAHSGVKPLATLPNVPSLTASGYPFNITTWYGIFVPAKTDPAIVNQLNKAVYAITNMPRIKQRLSDLNLTELPEPTPEQFRETVRSDMERWRKLIKEINIRLD